MKLYNNLAAACLVPLVASQLGGDTYQTRNVTIDLDKVVLSNDADCGKATGDFDNLYKTANCRSPVGSTPLRGLSGDNIIYGENNFALFTFNSVRPFPDTLFSGPAAFDVAFDVDSLEFGGNSSISLQLVWKFRTLYVADETITFNAKDNGQPPYKVNVNKTGVSADSISVEAYVLDGGSISTAEFKLGIFNIDFGLSSDSYLYSLFIL
ncbi:hypothetical protein NQ176_g7938 [Zarea fungicola]|uniref:Uncharacterized protein n=1 Tax=Zarea fungicola TaxID=93591 RepID=A0ACC1MVC0_9HYPO|nr:hypothetical protein NQ176_g7938 [Lecanicillium fungicola]